jgi:hypothetical protein
VLFTFALMYQFDASLVTRPRTFSAFVDDHEQLYAKHAAKFVSKTTFVAAWWRWNSLLEINFDVAFSCADCDKLPASQRCYVIDGTHLGIKSSELKLDDPPPPLDVQFGCLDTSVRLLVDDKTLRDLLLEFSKRELTAAEAKTMHQRAAQHASWLTECLDVLQQRNLRRAPPVLQRLIAAVSHPTPVSGLILQPASTLPALTALARGDNIRSSPALWSLVIDNCPCIASLLSDSALDSAVLSALRPVFAHFEEKCKGLTSGAVLRMLLKCHLYVQGCPPSFNTSNPGPGGGRPPSRAQNS